MSEKNKKTLGMMQPYFFPYLGYWQLMNLVDEYIIYDDVNFIKRGWIHRNRIKMNQGAVQFSISIRKVSQNKKINELYLNMNDDSRDKLLLTFQCAYSKAPYYEEVAALLKDILYCGKENLAAFLAYANRKTAEYMGITTKILSATEMGLDHRHHGQDRILDVCKDRGIERYIIAIGGKELYDQESFSKINCELKFLRMDEDIHYPQGKGTFLPSLSILDVLVYNSQEEVKDLLARYRLED